MNIAILISTYNSSKTIGATIDSIKTQGEALNRICALFIADDCSTDDTILSVKSHWDIEVPLRIIKRNHNLGEWKNVNQAIETLAQRVDWFIYMHSDNIAKPGWLKHIISRIETCSKKVATVCSSYDIILPDGTIIRGEDNAARPIEVIDGNEDSVRGTLTRGCWWHNSGCALRIDAFKSVGNFDAGLKQKGDWDWLLRCLQKGWSVEYIPRTLFLYRQRQDNLSSQNLRRNIDIKESLEIVQKYTKILSKRELFFLHLRQTKYTMRRIGGGLIKFDIIRCLCSIVTLAFIFSNFLRCLYKKT